MNNGERTTINTVISDPMSGPGIFNMSFMEIFNKELMSGTTYCFNVSVQIEQTEDDSGKYFV